MVIAEIEAHFSYWFVSISFSFSSTLFFLALSTRFQLSCSPTPGDRSLLLITFTNYHQKTKNWVCNGRKIRIFLSVYLKCYTLKYLCRLYVLFIAVELRSLLESCDFERMTWISGCCNFLVESNSDFGVHNNVFAVLYKIYKLSQKRLQGENQRVCNFT